MSVITVRQRHLICSMRSNNTVFKCCTCKTLYGSTVMNFMQYTVIIRLRILCTMSIILGVDIPECKKRVIFIVILRIRVIYCSILISLILRIRYTRKLQRINSCINLCNLIKSFVCISRLPVASIVTDDILYLSYKIAVCKDCVFHCTD